MYDVWEVLQHVIKFYVDEISSILEKQDKLKNKDEGFEIFCCLVINTGEYCKETLMGLADTVKNYLDSPFKEKVEYDKEEQFFIDLLTDGMNCNVGFAEHKLENPFM